MILKIEDSFFGKFSDADIADFCYYAAEHGHFIDCEPQHKVRLKKCVAKHCGTNQKKVFMYALNRFTHLTDEHRIYLTTINGSAYAADILKSLLQKPARLLLENKMYEGPVYKRMIGSYKHDRQYGNMYTLLEIACNKGWLEFANGGGYGGFEEYLKSINNGEYKDIVKQKFCTLMDRDMKSAILPDNRDPLFGFLSGGKNHHTLADSDIYTLTFPLYIWHLWYKRAIENYFPDSSYVTCSYNPIVIWPADPTDRNYKKIVDKGKGRFHKEDLPKLANSMSRYDYENGLQHFIVNGQDMSELQLFLLKIVKII